MPTIKFTYALKRFYPGLKEVSIAADTVADVVRKLDEIYPRMSTYIVDERGALRKHVNIFIGSTIIEDKISLADKVRDDDEVYIMQALSGG
ncbi:MoaD/ThiS family protein [Fulvivirgaceae bacterium BMA12]|uniref:MoaD/ThiS family protein n=1 Tax=Agaribacillus aureus TaxID=3051825 RepID=A0ABT8L2F4_9BACT|nr:MoaD/ThiS family protein [Fulvivirgaceae bacterium BMA12]